MASDNNNHFESDKQSAFGHDEALFADIELQKVHQQIYREKSEPREHMTPVPMMVLFFCAVLFFFAGFYLARFSGGFKSDSFNEQLFGAPVAASASTEVFDPIKRGQKLFANNCQQCHQADGHGLPGVYPPLAGSHWLNTDPMRPIKIVLKGLSGPITVEDKNFNGNMPNFAHWKDRDLAAVLTFVRQNWGNTGTPISESDVTKVRDEIKARSAPWTGPELLKENPL